MIPSYATNSNTEIERERGRGEREKRDREKRQALAFLLPLNRTFSGLNIAGPYFVPVLH